VAFLRSIRHKCSNAYCKKLATVELIDRWNSSRGYFCRLHGSKAKKEQEKNESGGF
jgi:hypothetical protein